MTDTPAAEEWRSEVARSAAAAFAAQRQLAERAVAQLDTAELFRTLDADGNSIAVLMKHVGGNLRSRWTEPFTTDGEKPERNRDGEFEVDGEAAEDVWHVWESGWGVLDAFLENLTAADFDRPLRIRGEALSLITALHRSLAHCAQHAGQIVLLARHWRGAAWQTLSIPKRRPAS